MSRDGEDLPVKAELVDSPTHAHAAKELEKRHPDLRVIRICQEWVPVSACHKCGTTIFKGDYQNDQIHKRNGKNYCLDCKGY